MEYPVNIDGFERQNIVLKTGTFFSGPKLLINGQEAPRAQRRGFFVLRRDDGVQVEAHFKMAMLLDTIPKIVVEGKEIEVVEPLSWYQWAWCALPICLVFLGGLIGGLVGGVATIINGTVFRTNLTGPVKYMMTGFISLIALFLYSLVVTIISALF